MVKVNICKNRGGMEIIQFMRDARGELFIGFPEELYGEKRLAKKIVEAAKASKWFKDFDALEKHITHAGLDWKVRDRKEDVLDDEREIVLEVVVNDATYVVVKTKRKHKSKDVDDSWFVNISYSVSFSDSDDSDAPTQFGSTQAYDTANEFHSGVGSYYYTVDTVSKTNPRLIDDAFNGDPSSYNVISKTMSKEISYMSKSLERFLDKESLKELVSSKASAKLNYKTLASDDAKKLWKKKASKRDATSVCFIFDLSGSMSGYPFTRGMVMLHAMNNNLLKRKKKGRALPEYSVYLTTGVGYYKLSLPVEPKLLDTIRPNSGSEGFQVTIDRNINDIAKHDIVIAYTDGMLVDGYPNEKHIKRLQKSNLFGMYFHGTERHEVTTVREQLNKHFGSSIVLRDEREFIDAVLRKYRSRR